MKNIGIIGGGAAGLSAGIAAALNGHKVTILEHKDRVGKKLLLTGSGKCNISNLDMKASHFHSSLDDKETSDFIEGLFRKCSPEDVLLFLKDLGLYLKDRNGYLYPYSEMASAVVDSFRFAAEDSGVKVITGINVLSIKHCKDNRYKVITDNNDFIFDRIIICCGSKAYEKTGSDGSGYCLAQELGESVVKPLPALTYFVCKEKYYSSLAGIRTKAKITLFDDNSSIPLGSDIGELQINKAGISGIPVFNISYLASRALDSKKKLFAFIDFLPDLSEEDALDLLKKKINQFPNRKLEELFIGILHKNIGLVLIKECGFKVNSEVSQLDLKSLKKLTFTAKNFRTYIEKTGGFDNSQVVCGGIDLRCVDENMQSLRNKGIYYAGEILDINGDCGGYNLHFAFTSALIAARHL